jgi:hypothetical protein
MAKPASEIKEHGERPVRAAAFDQGKHPTIAFVNKATVTIGVDLDKLVNALQKQIDRDFVPVWGYPAKLYVTKTPAPNDWQIVFFDDADVANALGYHDITVDGQPVSKVFVSTVIAAGEKISVTASHELLEMLIDPGAQLWASANGYFYAYELCDAVEEEEYEIDGVAVSDFVYPSFFEPWRKPRSARFDHLEKVSSPLQTLQRGYQIVSNGRSVREIFGSAPKEMHFRTQEVRTLHRSEYRKLQFSPAPDGPVADLGHHSADMLHQAGALIMAVAAMVDPLPGGESYRTGFGWDPLPGGDPWRTRFGRRWDQLPGGNPWRTRFARQWDPLPGGDPWRT